MIQAREIMALAEELSLRPDVVEKDYVLGWMLYGIGSQLARRLRDTSRKASSLAFLDVSDRIVRTLNDLAQEPEALSHPQGTQLRISRQELARLVGCSREMAGRVLKKLQADEKLHARGKTLVLYGTR